MEDIKEHDVLTTPVRQPSSFRQKIALDSKHIPQPGFTGLLLNSRDHIFFNVQGVNHTLVFSSRRDCECSITAAQIRDISSQIPESQLIQNDVRIKKLIPHFLLRHSTFAKFHGISPSCRWLYLRDFNLPVLQKLHQYLPDSIQQTLPCSPLF